MAMTAFKSMKDLPVEHLLAPGTPMCAGCGGVAAIKLFHDVLGKNIVFVNAAGCLTLLANYPFTPFQGSWLYTAMACAPAGAQGIRDGLDILLRKKVLRPKDDLKVVVVTGDGAANGIGIASTSGTLDRGLDFYYLCYDNEGFGNTGHQTSSATPYGAFTATDNAGVGYGVEKKDLFAVWSAHDPPYLATVSVSEPVDFARKLEKAKTLYGPKLFIALTPCPTGWHFEPRETVRIGKLAVQTGIWPLKEYVNGTIVHNRSPIHPGKRPPVADYLKAQGRFRHLFSPKRQTSALRHIQERVDHYWESLP